MLWDFCKASLAVSRCFMERVTCSLDACWNVSSRRSSHLSATLVMSTQPTPRNSG
jgi:hypothetical protein